MCKTLATYPIAPGLSLFLVRGSVVHFEGKTTDAKAAIVNAANPGCLGGGGVDGAISAAGGARLMEDRLHLPVLERRGEYEIRCHVGSAVCTGPGDYDELRVPYVLHAVGPNYNSFDEEEYDQAHELLKSAYSTTLDIASENRIEEVAFSLLSAGVFRGSCSLAQVLRLGIESIVSWGKNRPEDSSVSGIHLFAFTPKECRTLKRICDGVFGIETEDVASDSDDMAVDTEETPKTDDNAPADDEKMEESKVAEKKTAEADDTVESKTADDDKADEKAEGIPEKSPKTEDEKESHKTESIEKPEKNGLMEQEKEDEEDEKGDTVSTNESQTKVEENSEKVEKDNAEEAHKSIGEEKSEVPVKASEEGRAVGTDDSGLTETVSVEKKQDE